MNIIFVQSVFEFLKEIGFFDLVKTFQKTVELRRKRHTTGNLATKPPLPEYTGLMILRYKAGEVSTT